MKALLVALGICSLLAITTEIILLFNLQPNNINTLLLCLFGVSCSLIGILGLEISNRIKSKGEKVTNE